LAGFLEAEQLEVVACADGQEAWESLCDKPDRFSLVVTDLEMPRLDGLELTRRIRADNSTAHLPVIALTSLASEDDMRRGKEAGVDEYLIKLDRDQLISAAARHLDLTPAAC
jgi:two-component system, chemotaxis family, sensor kinase CheA